MTVVITTNSQSLSKALLQRIGVGTDCRCRCCGSELFSLADPSLGVLHGGRRSFDQLDQGLEESRGRSAIDDAMVERQA